MEVGACGAHAPAAPKQDEADVERAQVAPRDKCPTGRARREDYRGSGARAVGAEARARDGIHAHPELPWCKSTAPPLTRNATAVRVWSSHRVRWPAARARGGFRREGLCLV